MFCSSWGSKGFSRICSDVDVESKQSDGMFDVFCCDGVWGVLWFVLLERSIGSAIGEWGMLIWTLGVCKFLFRLECIICLFISSVFWFWLCWLALLRSCWRGSVFYQMVRIVDCLEMLVELLVLVNRTIVRVFLQMYMDCLEKKCVLMIGDCLFDYLLVLLEVLGMLLVGTGVGVVD